VSASLLISTADVAGVATMLDWAADEGWNPGLHDAAAFHAADPEGFLIGSLDGEPVAAISLVRYDPAFAFLGLYLVRPGWRGLGHGMAMWRAAIAHAGDRIIGLDGVVARQADYARSGFTLVRRNVRYGGTGIGGRVPHDLVPLDEIEAEVLRAYDRDIFPASRAAFLAAWAAMPGSRGLAALDGGRLVGYAVARPCRTGVKVGPLFANDPSVAESLFAGLSAWAGTQPIFLDVPESNEHARLLAERHRLEPAFETARMYAGGVPVEPVERIYGVTTFELG